MRQVSLEPRHGPSGPPRVRFGATMPMRLLGLALLTLAIVVPGCQAILYGHPIASPTPVGMPGLTGAGPLMPEPSGR